MRPDYGRMQRQHNTIAEFAGETARWQAYVSASAGDKPAYGGGNEPQYITRTITALFAQPRINEQPVEGGEFLAGDMMVSMANQPHANDRIVWRGNVYLIQGHPIPQTVLGAQVWRTHLRIGGASA